MSTHTRIVAMGPGHIDADGIGSPLIVNLDLDERDMRSDGGYTVAELHIGVVDHIDSNDGQSSIESVAVELTEDDLIDLMAQCAILLSSL